MYCDGSSFRPDINKDFSLDRRRHNVPLILKNGTKSKVVVTPEVLTFKVLSAKLKYNVLAGDT